MYVKAPKEIVDYLASKGYDHHYDTSNDRQVFADGSYLLWERDFLPLCASEEVSAKLPTLGCLALTAVQVRAEQDGETVNELPDITDERLLDYLGREPQTPAEDPQDPAEDPEQAPSEETTPSASSENSESSESSESSDSSENSSLITTISDLP